MATLKSDSRAANSAGKFITGNACILIATISWGVNVSFTKALIPEWMTSEGISAVRLIGGCTLFWIGSLFVKNSSISGHDWLKLALGGGTSSDLPWGRNPDEDDRRFAYRCMMQAHRMMKPSQPKRGISGRR